MASTAFCSLRFERRENPVGIDVLQPRLSWELTCNERGQFQTAYQVLAASSEAALKAHKGDLWDSGKVASDQLIEVRYADKPLAL